MKVLVLILAILYVMSPVDIAPGVPLDDIIAIVASISHVLKSAN